MISIIIPVYRVEDFLDECLQSVVGQSYTDFECILVDDGSPDRSGEICDAWAAEDSCFRVIHQQNAGVSAARNRGLDEARGEWITFIDSDDWVDSDYLASLAAHADDCDWVVAGYKIHRAGRVSTLAPKQDTSFDVRGNSEHVAELFENYCLFGPCCKLFSNQIVTKNRLRFDTRLSFAEDLHFCFSYLPHAGRIHAVYAMAYHYRLHGNESLSTKFYPDKIDIDLGSYARMLEVFRSLELFDGRLKHLMYHRLYYFTEIDVIEYLRRSGESFFGCWRWMRSKLRHAVYRDKDYRRYVRSNIPRTWIRHCLLHRVHLPLLLRYHHR